MLFRRLAAAILIITAVFAYYAFAQSKANYVLANNSRIEGNAENTPPFINPASFYTNLLLDKNFVNRKNQIEVEIRFSRWVDMSWFDSLTVSISSDGGTVNAKGKVADMAAAEAIYLSDITKDILRITDLSKAFPEIDSRNFTSGVMNFSIICDKENVISKDWGDIKGIIKDRAAPMLVNENEPSGESYIGAVFKSGSARRDSGFYPDTLLVTYTEELYRDFTKIKKPLKFWRGNHIGEPELQVISHSFKGGGSDGWYQVTYLVPSGTEFFQTDYVNPYLAQNDSVSINFSIAANNIEDIFNNRQNRENKKIPVRVQWSPDNLYVTLYNVGKGSVGQGKYAPGEQVLISAGASPAGKRFVRWKVRGTNTGSSRVVIYRPNYGKTFFTMPPRSVELEAVFEDNPYIQENKDE